MGATIVTCAATLSLGLALAVTAPVLGPAGFDGAAYAKGGNGNGNGGGKGGGRGGGGGNGAERGGGKGADKGNRGGNGWGRDKGQGGFARGNATTNRGQAKKQASRGSDLADDVYEDRYGEEFGALSANQRGRWNAAKANQAAFDAHVRNQNFNGTIGALAQYQLAGKAAAGADLSPEEQAALDSLIGERDPVGFTDAELEAVLNGSAVEGEPVFEVTDGVASCVENCNAEGFDPDTIDADANSALDVYRDAEQMAADRQAVEDFYTASEQRIIDESNKPTAGIEDALLDDIAQDLGFERPEITDVPDDLGEADTAESGAGTVDDPDETIVLAE